MRTIDIPGGTAVLRHPDDMTERQRRLVRTALFAAAADAVGDMPADGQVPDTVHLTSGLGSRMFELRDAGIVAALVSWTLEQPLPTLDTVIDLPGPVYDRLAAETSRLVGSLTTDFDASPDPESPTPPSSASDGPLRGEDTPTPTPPTSGESTSTASSTT